MNKYDQELIVLKIIFQKNKNMLNTPIVSVGVDLSEMDESILKYTQFLVGKLHIKKINMIHIIPSILSFENTDVKVHEILGAEYSLKGKIEKLILDRVQPIFQNGLQPTIEISDGKPYQDLVVKAENLKSELLVLGRKKESAGSGITAQRIARKFHGNILFIPEGAQPLIQKIIVPMDFSDNSARALQAAIELATQLKGCMVRCVHIVNTIPSTYYLDMKTRSQLDGQAMMNTENAWGMFLDKNDWSKKGILIDFVQNTNTNTANLLSDFLKSQHTDLVIMGAKGHTAFENFLYGSLTETLVNQYEASPILIIR